MKNKRDQAKARVEFRIHVFIFIAVIVLLAIINLFTSPENLWFIWPMLGWGIGLVVHALRVYVFSGEEGLKERMIQHEMNKDN
ncbi:MAG: 2TM domain-containing protein [Saprospiraceae bacterium]|nr:2TM domain-containing protein [Lewinella sp.]